MTPKFQRKLVLLTKETGWYGSHSGYYEQLPYWLCHLAPSTQVIRPQRTWFRRAAGKLIAMTSGFPPRDQSITFAEAVFQRRFNRGQNVGHLLCVEDNLPMLLEWSKAPRSLIATIHFPPERTTTESQEYLKRLSSAIVLYQKDIEWFEKLIGKERVRFVRHGVDLEYFCPAASSPETLRVAYVGQFERNTAMLARVAPILLKRFPNLWIDVVVAPHALQDPFLNSIRGLERVVFHLEISDDDLRAIYQNARCLLLPMRASGANNAIVESLACGLPIATTDIGGIRDYGGGSVFPIVPNDDDDALVDLTSTYLENEKWRNDLSALSRNFAESNLDWAETTRHHLKIYSELAA